MVTAGCALLAPEGPLQTWQSESPGWCRLGLASLGCLNWPKSNTDPRMRNTRRSNMAPSQTRLATESVDLPQCGVARVVRHAEQGIMGTPRSRGLFYSLHFV